MKALVRNLLFAGTVAAFTAAMAMLYSCAVTGKHYVTCNALDVQLQQDGRFVTEQDIKDYLKDYYGPYLGERIDSVNLARVEKALDRRSVILSSEAWTTDDGTLHISITQREPAVRFQSEAGGYYADETGFIFPLQKNYTPKVPIVDGEIPLNAGAHYKGYPGSNREKEWIRGILDLVGYMDSHKAWADSIDRITVLANGDLMLYPQNGNERFIFGAPNGMKEKFGRMEDYYRYIKPS